MSPLSAMKPGLMINAILKRIRTALSDLAGVNYRRWLIAAVLLFITGLVLGAVASPSLSSIYDTEYLEELAEMLSPLSAPALMFAILFNNMIALSISFALSPIFLIMPMLSLVTNGWVLSAVGAEIIQQESLGYFMAGIMPHGIFEIPALIIAQAAALSFGAMVVSALFVKEKRPLVIPSLKQNLKYMGIAVLLMIPAAIIEAFITPLLLS